MRCRHHDTTTTLLGLNNLVFWGIVNSECAMLATSKAVTFFVMVFAIVVILKSLIRLIGLSVTEVLSESSQFSTVLFHTTESYRHWVLIWSIGTIVWQKLSKMFEMNTLLTIALANILDVWCLRSLIKFGVKAQKPFFRSLWLLRLPRLTPL